MPSFGLNGLENATSLASTALGAAITAGATTITVTDGSRMPTANFVVKIGSELIFVDSRASNTLTVNASGRGYASTTAAAHSKGVEVRHVLSSVGLQLINDTLEPVFESAGDIGIGAAPVSSRFTITSPEATKEALRIIGSDGTTATVSLAPNGATGNTGKIQGVTDGTNTDIAIILGGSERVRFDNGGNVGIGTSSPDEDLEVAGSNATVQITATGNSTPHLRLREDTAAKNFDIRVANATGDLIFVNSGLTEVMRIEEGGTLRFGAHTALGAETVTGYITIKDAGGVTRKLAVVS